MVAACIALAGQPLSAGYQLPSIAPSGLGAMASHSSYSLGTSPSLFHFNLTQSSKSCVHYMLSNYLFECALSLCQDRKTKTLTGKSQEFWAQFSSVQFNLANIYRARSSEPGSVPGAGDMESDAGTVPSCRVFMASWEGEPQNAGRRWGHSG